MLAKVVLGLIFAGMVAGGLYFDPVRERSLLGTRQADGPRLRVMTWNIGYASLEKDSRAQTKDMPAIADAILRADPDAVALQEIASTEQFDTLLLYLRRRYRGRLSSFGSSDRAEAVLVKDKSAHFEDVPAGEHYAVAATFKLRDESPEVILVSAHADAFNAARRRVFAGEVVDWTRSKPEDVITFIAGDFNFEVNARNRSNLFTDNLKHDSEAYSHVLKYYRDLGRDAGWTALNERRIDYVFGPRETVLFRRAEVLKGAAVGHMDHWPLIVEVVL
jgi:endonuclease/exonuclease/phosphatase family metal-dependent hydrolase